LKKESRNEEKPIVKGETNKLSEVEKELIKVVKSEEELIHEEFDLIKKMKSLPTNVNVNVKYNIVTSLKPSNTPNPTTLDPIIKFLETEINLPHDTDEIDSNQSPQIRRPNVHIKSETKVTTTEPTIYKNDSKQIQLKEEQYLTMTVTEKQPTRKPKKKLSASDFLRLCFTSGIGCDFNHNNVEEEILTTEPNTTPRQETTYTTPTPLIIPTESSSGIMERLRQRVKLCFFSSICNNPGNDSAAQTIIRQPRVISAQATERPQKPKQKTKSRSNKIRAQIQARAKACFYEGKCN